MISAELLLAALSYTLSVFVSAQGRGAAWALSVVRATLVLAVAFRLAGLLQAQLYKKSLRWPTALDLVSITKTVFASSMLLGIFALWRFPALNLSVNLFVVDAAFLELLWCGLHFGARVRKTQQAVSLHRGRRAIIVGAGDAGMTLLREIALDDASPFQPVAILDDDASKWGRTICGVPVQGGTTDLAATAKELRADEVLVCIPSATRSQMRVIFDICRHSCLPVRTLPSLSELLFNSGSADKSSVAVSRRDLRLPGIEDLLQREEIHADPEETRRLIRDEVVLVTGAGGSIGSELCLQLAAAGPRRLLLLDKSENGLFFVNLEASEQMGSGNVIPLLADLVDRDRVRQLFRTERPSTIFHAAAHKHVAMLELHPREAIRNNVIGTRNVAEAAVEFGASRFVNISTDKAVRPQNYMGLSKKITELCVQELSSLGATRFSSVRFGNVAGSSGSVLRLFWEHIERRKPVPVTDPRATRFFMSVREAVHLILRAAALGRGGETFVLEMGEPMNIYDLAKTMMLFSGLRPDHDLKIEFTGLQPGEKISEELWEDREKPIPAESDHILVIRDRDPLSRGILAKIGKVEELLAQSDESALAEYLCTVFPDFRWSRRERPQPPAPPIARAARSAGAA